MLGRTASGYLLLNIQSVRNNLDRSSNQLGFEQFAVVFN